MKPDKKLSGKHSLHSSGSLGVVICVQLFGKEKKENKRKTNRKSKVNFHSTFY